VIWEKLKNVDKLCICSVVKGWQNLGGVCGWVVLQKPNHPLDTTLSVVFLRLKALKDQIQVCNLRTWPILIKKFANIQKAGSVYIFNDNLGHFILKLLSEFQEIFVNGRSSRICRNIDIRNRGVVSGKGVCWGRKQKLTRSRILKSCGSSRIQFGEKETSLNRK